MSIIRVLTVAFALAVLLPGRAPHLSAQGTAGVLFGSVEQPGAKALAPAPATGTTTRARLVSARLDAFDRRGFPDAASRTDRHLTLNLFDDVSFQADMTDVEMLSPTEFIWRGTIRGHQDATTALVVKGDVLVGEVRTSTELYEIRPAAGGTHVIRQTDPGKFPPSREPVIKLPPAGSVQPDVQTQGDDGKTIDVLVVWTPAAQAAAGGVAAIEGLIDLAVSNANSAYAASGVFQRMRLVHKEAIAYTESGSSAAAYDVDLDRLAEEADGFMDTVHALRMSKGADLVGLIVNNASQCGIAYALSINSSFFEYQGFSVNHYDCIAGNLTLAHEMGHNQGLAHDTGSAGIYSYSRGHSEPGGTFRTVMAVASAVPRVGNFSNPAISRSGIPTGVVGVSENARTLNETALAVGNYRKTLYQDILIGLGGGGGGGYLESVRGGAPHANLGWLQVAWPAYNAANGDTRPVSCQVDNDSEYEVVIGLGTYTADGGWLQVRDDSQTGYAHLKWLRIDWPAYNAANGETFPACGDLDLDGRDEIVVGLGSGGGGYIRLFEDHLSGYGPVPGTAAGWLQVGWSPYNGANGATYPAVGNLDADGAREIAIGFGSGGGGYVKLLNDRAAAFAPMSGTAGGAGWIVLGWPAYNSANGTVWPAIGDLNNDGASELVLGVGSGGGGWLQVRGNNTAGYAAVGGTPTAGGWLSVSWPPYNSAVGITYPAIGDVDGDLRNELVIGLGTYPTAGGYFEVREDLTGGLVHKSWGRVNWVPYHSSNGSTRPAIGR